MKSHSVETNLSISTAYQCCSECSLTTPQTMLIVHLGRRVKAICGVSAVASETLCLEFVCKIRSVDRLLSMKEMFPFMS